MQRAKINAAVSSKRGYIKPPEHCCGLSGFGMGVDDFCPACREETRFDAKAYEKKFHVRENKDWLADANWPALLRDMLAAGRQLEFRSLRGHVYIQIDYTKHSIPASDEGEAVCLAWLIHMDPVCSCERHWDSEAEATVTDPYRCLLHHKVL